MSRSDQTFESNIVSMRAVEDCIRATKKYTEYFGTMRWKHPIQGNDFPSKVLCKHYEVYPDIELDWDMSASVALDWVWGDTPHLDVFFKYDYRINKATVYVRGGDKGVLKLARAIPNFNKALAEAKVNGDGSRGKV
tara:strand:- start:977 stop:1384 length:408 start_codon:yes stop_codon:yes gene_type:complete